MNLEKVKKAGRPKKEISKEQFESLCGLQCTKEEIAFFFRCSNDTIERFCKDNYSLNFADTYKKYSSTGKISLRRAQFKLAQTNASMAIFLGKQYLGQKDNINDKDDAEDKEIKVSFEIRDFSGGDDDAH